MRTANKISNAIIKRLPIYRRYLGILMRQGVEQISSYELSEFIGFTASQIRQDLNTFGEFGQQGYGYDVAKLYGEVNRILGLDKEHKTVIVGMGNIGKAITNYTYYYRIGFNIIGLFDASTRVIGSKVDNMVIQDVADLSEWCKEHEVEVGIICVNRENAQGVADAMIEGGIKGIWNFAPIDLDIPSDVALESVHLSDSLHTLSYKIASLKDANK